MRCSLSHVLGIHSSGVQLLLKSPIAQAARPAKLAVHHSNAQVHAAPPDLAAAASAEARDAATMPTADEH